MKSILEDIKTQNFKQAYLLYGEEAYLKHQYKNKLKNALLPEDDTMNFSRFEGKGTEIPNVIDLAETMPKKLVAHTGMDAMTHAIEDFSKTKPTRWQTIWDPCRIIWC